jgi:hypothetical protein
MTLSHPLGVSIPRAREPTRAGALRSSATTPQPRPHDLTDHRFASVAKGPSEPRKVIITTSVDGSLRTSWSIGLKKLASEAVRICEGRGYSVAAVVAAAKLKGDLE